MVLAVDWGHGCFPVASPRLSSRHRAETQGLPIILSLLPPPLGQPQAQSLWVSMGQNLPSTVSLHQTPSAKHQALGPVVG